ncbi:hypothetical protein GCK72_016183 [Caenorhabditis remanei]|uniref:Uncharacterized protein n=1 Tax=Caenorhabditis remanei TaxID=31234 RepID=A0A6A5GYR4_CAERE|nr:hypothetical protein GCK72_016183 [Caenorhabditis remanei]KAF1759716.1 hypothetical protein GCK72_016183 [Caenorhabditis remanei]
MMKKDMKNLKTFCQICNSTGNGLHFGVEACRGCTSFFRRSIVQEKVYKCNEDYSCDIGNLSIDMSQKCRRCRFEKCLNVGMKKDAVQKNRDSYGSRKNLMAVVPSPSGSNRLKFPVPSLILEPIGNNYSHLENLRLVVHLEEGSSMFMKKVPRRHTFKETDKLMRIEFEIIKDWIFNSFPQISDLETDQKNILLRHFYIQFFILEGGFLACKKQRNDVWFLPNGDYIDCQNLGSFYTDHSKPQQSSTYSENAAKLSKGTCVGCRRMVTHPMLREKIDQFKFLALAALILFESGLEGQSKESSEICYKIRNTVQRELLQYYAARRVDEYSLRVGNILSILPSLQKATYKMLDDMELVHLLNNTPDVGSFYKYFSDPRC